MYTFEAGGTTPLATYSDASLSTLNANPVEMDSAGRATIFLQPRAYKLVFKTAADATLWTRDNVLAFAPYNIDTTIDGTAGETLAAGSICFLMDNSGTGGRTAGRWYLADADAVSTSTTPQTIGVAVSQIITSATGQIRISGRASGFSGLTVGATYYVSGTAGLVTTSAPANARVVGVADSAGTLVLQSDGPVPAARVTAGSLGAGNYTVTGNLTTTGVALVADGVVATPSIAFTADADTGFYRTGTNGFAATAGGSEQVRWVGGQQLGGDGSVGGPAVSFLADADTGIYRTGANGIGVTAGGTEQTRWVGTQTLLPDGAYTGPALSFLGDVNTGIYRNASDDIRISAGAADVAGFYNAGFQVFKAATFDASITANALGSATTGTDLVISAGNAIRPKSSSRRYKENEQAWTGDSRKLLALVPKTFDYKGDGAKGVLFFIAEDVADIDPIYVNTNAEGQPESIRTDALVAALVDLVQRQEQRIAALEARLA